MSVEQRGPDPIHPADERRRLTRPTPVAGSSYRQRSSSHQSSAVSDRQELPLSYRIERTQHQVRIATLERALEASERRRQAIVDQYERLLAERTDTTDSSPCESPSQSRSVLTWLFDR
ncbi:hypothetical protein ACFR99_18265 [Haloarchaeobius amylolyticus]|uniref:Uncharacterized protein n=1 Tax=Haloarchaeobius amylolyticus TaxID=1198296 RepID=A0ABD6BL64_9EURY